MSAVLAPFDQVTRPSPRQRRAERRRLKQHDALSRRLAELHAIRALVGQAADVVSAGWVQGAWFAVATAGGNQTVTAYELPLAVNQPVRGACLVGAIVQSAGGPATVRSQLVQRTLDLARHALRENPDRPVQWCPGPRMRMMGVLELTHWNDAPERTQGEVVDFLLAAQRTVDKERNICRAKQAQLATVTSR